MCNVIIKNYRQNSHLHGKVVQFSEGHNGCMEVRAISMICWCVSLKPC